MIEHGKSLNISADATGEKPVSPRCLRIEKRSRALARQNTDDGLRGVNVVEHSAKQKTESPSRSLTILGWLFLGSCAGVFISFIALASLPAYVTFGLTTGSVAAAFCLFFLARRRDGRNAAQLHEAVARAESANETKSKFLAMVSHEIRTPLNGVLGMAQLLADTKLNPAQADYVKAIDTSGRALLGLIEDLLDSARIEAGQMDVQATPSDIRQLVEDVADILAPRAREKGVDIATHIASSVPELLTVDAARLRQVLLNLAGNAAKFTQSGGIAITVHAENDDVHFSVEDTGPGLSDADQLRIFEEFMQASSGNTRAHEGAGLGLSISRKLVIAMGGTGISLDSREGHGSTFKFALPAGDEDKKPIINPQQNITVQLVLGDTPARTALASTLADLGVFVSYKPIKNCHAIIADRRLKIENVTCPVFWLGDAGERGNHKGDTERWLTWPVRADTLQRLVSQHLHAPKAASPVEPIKAPTPKHRAKRVLVAEDNPINAMLVTALLGKLGHHVVRVDNGAEAVRAVESGRGPFDIILMDLHMPEMDGTQAIAKIRGYEALNKARRHKIVVLSADGQETAREAAIEAGGDGFLLKPLDLDTVSALFDEPSEIENRIAG